MIHLKMLLEVGAKGDVRGYAYGINDFEFNSIFSFFISIFSPVFVILFSFWIYYFPHFTLYIPLLSSYRSILFHNCLSCICNAFVFNQTPFVFSSTCQNIFHSTCANVQSSRWKKRKVKNSQFYEKGGIDFFFLKKLKISTIIIQKKIYFFY